MIEGNRIAIFGMGYVGLTLAVVMAEVGYEVIGVEINPNTIQVLQSGQSHFYEIGLNLRLARVLEKGSLRFVSNVSEIAGTECSAAILTVGTPLGSKAVFRKPKPCFLKPA